MVPSQGGRLASRVELTAPAPPHVAARPLMGDWSLAVACMPCWYQMDTSCAAGVRHRWRSELLCAPSLA